MGLYQVVQDVCPPFGCTAMIAPASASARACASAFAANGMSAGMFSQPPTPVSPKLPDVKAKGDTLTYTSAYSQGRVIIFRAAAAASWDNATTACRRLGGVMFSPDKVEELQELKQAMSLGMSLLREPLHAVWIGARREAGSRARPWQCLSDAISETAIVKLPPTERPELLMWNLGEPNGQLQERVCLMVSNVLSTVRNSVWMNDHDCEKALPYVCSINWWGGTTGPP
jgi:hypothetical protein